MVMGRPTSKCDYITFVLHQLLNLSASEANVRIDNVNGTNNEKINISSNFVAKKSTSRGNIYFVPKLFLFR